MVKLPGWLGGGRCCRVTEEEAANVGHVRQCKIIELLAHNPETKNNFTVKVKTVRVIE